VLEHTVDSMKLARDLYLQCLEEDPDYAPAWARLGRAYRFIEKFGEETEENFRLCDEAFRRAFAINPDLTVAHNLYTPIEADLGHAQQAMVRLLERARFRRNDPELLAGLVQACRYCGELAASVAAHGQARQLDPHVPTSISHTYFLLCDYPKTLETYGSKGGYYLDAAALAAMGRDREAIDRLREREPRSPVGAIQAMMRSLRLCLEQDRTGVLSAANTFESFALRDPESWFYVVRHLARIGECDRAIALLSKVIEHGYLCDFALAHDPWLDSLRSNIGFAELARRFRERRSAAHRAFVEAAGEEILKPDPLTAGPA
jgi:tetratricopeptide (TPR) repeat protein